MPYDPKLITGKYLAQRVGFYMAQQGTPCTVYSFNQPTFSAKGLPSGSSYTVQQRLVTVLLQFSQAAAELASTLGLVDQQAAVGFVQAKDAGQIKERDFIKDNQGQFFVVHDLPNAQPLGGVTVGAQLLFIRTVKPPAGVV